MHRIFYNHATAGVMISIVEVNSKKRMKQFISFPHQLHKNDTTYVPLPNLLQRGMLGKKSNPFFQHGDACYFLAVNEHHKTLGRIAAIYNKVHLDIYNDGTGFFGYFDCINDQQVAGLLLEKAAAWLGEKGLKKIAGPENLTTNDSAGVLTKGFTDSPCFLMPYNFPYYKELLEKSGYSKLLSLFSYKTEPATLPGNMFQKSAALKERLQKKGISIRFLDLNNFNREMIALRKVYNDVNKDNWGFLPLDEASFHQMAADLRKLVDKESVLLAEKEGKLIGFIVTVPDFNQVFKKISNGNLLPFGWWHLLRGRKKITRIRVMIMGVLPQWRGLGIDWCLYAGVAEYVKNNGLDYGEACYVMENNTAMNKMMKALGADVVKEYQLFEKTIRT